MKTIDVTGCKLIPVFISETDGKKRENEVVNIGVSLTCGFALSNKEIVLLDENRGIVPCQFKVLSLWHDKSIKWVLCTFLISIEKSSSKTVYLYCTQSQVKDNKEINCIKKNTQIEIKCKNINFNIPIQGLFKPIEKCKLQGGTEILIDSSIVLLPENNEKLIQPIITNSAVEESGDIYTQLYFSGFFPTKGLTVPIHFKSRVYIYHAVNLLKLDFIIHNPNRAIHKGSLWDLGDKNAFIFKGLWMEIMLDDSKAVNFSCKDQDTDYYQKSTDLMSIYQYSSGNSEARAGNCQCDQVDGDSKGNGCSIITNDEQVHLKRISPFCTVDNNQIQINFSIQDFWQNYPKKISFKKNVVKIELFPECRHISHELQPGEQKLHTCYFEISASNSIKQNNLIGWHKPLQAHLHRKYFNECNVMQYLPACETDNKIIKIIDKGISDNNGFKEKNKIIDEYGWRNWGDLYADHESFFNERNNPYTSHYNNQYDILYGFLCEFARTGNFKWDGLAHNLARHVRDIDVYHTNKDRSDFNGGLFWHTNHYLDAGTCTHRGFSIEHKKKKGVSSYGGGPSPAHTYLNGLIYHYYFSGEQWSLDAAIEIADYTMRMAVGPKKVMEFILFNVKNKIKESINYLKKNKVNNELRSPCRASGNVLNCLLDMYNFSYNVKFLKTAERFINKCISPKDNFNQMDLDDAEKNWSYIVFLQALGKYLDIKISQNLLDANFEYGKASLLHYVKWMAEYEKPYLDNPEKLEFPTESWAATEIRKVNVFIYAAKYSNCEEEKRLFNLKADCFYEICVRDLEKFPERQHFTRTLAILLTSYLLPLGKS